MRIRVTIVGILSVLVLLGAVLGLFSTNDIAIHDETKIEISSIADDCIYRIVAISGSGFALGDVCLIIVDPNSTILLPSTPLTAFNSSGELYYHFVRFNDGNDTGQLNVGDYFQFNRAMYWGSVFRLTDSGSTTMYCEVTIDDADGYFAVSIPMNYGPPGLSYPGSPMILLIFSIAAAAILIGTAVMVRTFKFEEEKRKQIWRLVAAVMGLLIVLFIAATLYTMVLYH